MNYSKFYTFPNPMKLIGNTPIIKLNRIVPSNININLWAKAEFFNLSGSIKDRIAYYMIKTAEACGKLKPGMTIVVPTTGNTGISFSAVGTYLGYNVMIVIPSEMSKERYLLMKLYGAEIRTVPGGEVHAYSSLQYALNLMKKEPDKYYTFDQWSDEANVWAHYETTGVEILNQLPNIKMFVAHIGTGGTLVGVAKRLKELDSNILVIGAEPSECPVTTYWFKNNKNVKCNRHEIEGVGDGFVPEIIKRYKNLIDDFVTVSSDEAINMAKEIAKTEGLGVGISSGANVMAVFKAVKEYGLNGHEEVLTIFPDNALRYFSTRLFLSKRVSTS